MGDEKALGLRGGKSRKRALGTAPTILKSDVFPASPAQLLCLNRNADPLCTEDTRLRWVLSHAVLVRPRVDMRRLQRACDKLFARHDILRARFVETAGGYGVCTEPAGTVAIRRIDLSDHDEDAFRARVTAEANAPMPLWDGPLAELVVLHGGQRGDAVVWRAHHAVTDGFGMVLIVEDFFKYLIGLPIHTKAMTVAEYSARFLKQTPARAKEIDAFWREKHRHLPKAPEIGRKAKGMEPLWYNLGKAVGKRCRIDVSQNSMARLTEQAHRAGVGSTATLFVGFLEALCRLYDTERLAYTTLIARSDPALSSFAGPHYFDPVLPYTAVGSDDLTRAAQALQADIALANEHLPSEAAAVANAYEKGLVAAGIFPRQFSVHQPRPTARMKKSVFSSGIRSAPGTEHRLGPYVLCRMTVATFTRSRCDLRFALRETQNSTGFDLEYDGISYDDAEISRLAAQVCDLLDLDLVSSSPA